MAHERGEAGAGNSQVNNQSNSKGRGAKVSKASGILGSLKDALMAASRDDTAPANPAKDQRASSAAQAEIVMLPAPGAHAAMKPIERNQTVHASPPPPLQNSGPSPSAEEAARLARTLPAARASARANAKDLDHHVEFDAPPTTRVMRNEAALKPQPAKGDRTMLVRGKQAIQRNTFEQDPVVGFLVVVGGPGLGSYRPVFEGNNTIGRADSNRVPLDFGDDTISSEAQAYIRYDSADRSFLFVPNLAKTNVVSVNEKRPTGAVELRPMDVMTLGRTQVAFVPFCGADFDWSEISES